VCQHLYDQVENKIQGKIASEKRSMPCSSRPTEEYSLKKEEPKNTVSASCQTEIQGTNLLIIT